MNNREMIEKWKSKEGASVYEMCTFPIRPSETEMYIAGYGVARKEILDDLKQLDEPKKVVVPKFVAEYIEIRKRHYEVGGLGAAIIKVLRSCNETDLASWMNNNTEVFARAWLDGYEVEKEQLYYVDFINDGDVHKRLILDHENGKYNIVDWSDNLIGLVQEMFTEQEIKAIDERYWQFAVKVDGE
ncbi:DUF1642 domain-containing protein [Enterococcus faecalis]|nr:DUF1642 domain-containing protein [Enterococcus faecalis]